MGHSTHRGGFLKPCGRSFEDSGKTLKSWERRIYGNHMSLGIEGRVDADWVFRYGMGVTQVKGSKGRRQGLPQNRV